MDCLPEINIKFQFEFDRDKKVDKDLVNTNDFKLLADIEGCLEVYVLKKLFFKENGILLLELDIELKKWLSLIQRNIIEDFCYKTMDYDEDYILQFIIRDQGWCIYSIWQEFKVEQQIPTSILIDTVNEFLKQLDEKLKLVYGINVEEFYSRYKDSTSQM